MTEASRSDHSDCRSQDAKLTRPWRIEDSPQPVAGAPECHVELDETICHPNGDPASYGLTRNVRMHHRLRSAMTCSGLTEARCMEDLQSTSLTLSGEWSADARAFRPEPGPA
jgi:hypothetical protein